ncbi:MAG: addiction module protein [Clostridia bacterium]|nr:addiction module protein [Clostridia bacterium]
MKNNSQLIHDISMLPIEDKLTLVDDLLRTINDLPNENIEIWKHEAERRVSDLKSIKHRPIEGQHIFNEIEKKYSK